MTQTAGRRQIDETDLVAIVERELLDAEGYDGGPLRGLQRRNIRAYMGAPYGNEKDGWSKHIDRTVLQTVESLMPYFMKVFHGNDEAASFAPVAAANPEEQARRIDEAGAATDYVNHVYNVDNKGYLVSSTVIKDALVQRYGVWKVEWLEEEREETRRYSNLDGAQVALLQQQGGDEVEIEVVGTQPTPQGPLYDIKVTKQWTSGRVAVEAIPPSQIVWAKRASDTEELPFIAEIKYVTRSDLVAQGLDRDMVAELPSHGLTTEVRRGQDWRNEDGESSESAAISERLDEAMEEVEIAECYIKIDLDDDGIAEWNCVVMAGLGGGVNGSKIIETYPCDGHPYIIMSPILLPHRIDGLSPTDLVEDVQRLRTEIIRQIVDGLFLTNHPRWGYRKGKVDLDELLSGDPGTGVGASNPDDIWRLDQTWEGAQALQLFPWLESLSESRSGVSPLGTVANSSLMTKHAEGTVDNLMQASMARQEYMARNMAEVGFTRLYRRILKLLIENQDRERMIRLRGEFVAMDPSRWSSEMDVEVNPALGIGRNAIRMQILKDVGDALTGLQERGFRGVGEAEIYNWLRDFLKAADMPATDPYCKDVTKMEPPAPPPPADPTQDIVYAVEAMKEDKRTERERMKLEMTAGLKGAELDIKRDSLDQDLVLKAEELESQEAIERIKAMQKQNDAQASQARPGAASPGEASSPAPAPVAARPAETFGLE